jgi:hypothetical protein
LPKKVDDDTELTAMSVVNNTLVFKYRLVKAEADSVNKSTFYEKIRSHLLVKICKDPEIKKIFSSGYSTSFDFSDKKGQPLAEVFIKSSDCNGSE